MPLWKKKLYSAKFKKKNDTMIFWPKYFYVLKYLSGISKKKC